MDPRSLAHSSRADRGARARAPTLGGGEEVSRSSRDFHWSAPFVYNIGRLTTTFFKTSDLVAFSGVLVVGRTQKNMSSGRSFPSPETTQNDT